MSSRKAANEWLNIIIGHVAAPQCGLGLGLGLGCTLVHFYWDFAQTSPLQKVSEDS